jgi:hypothetical protein
MNENEKARAWMRFLHIPIPVPQVIIDLFAIDKEERVVEIRAVDNAYEWRR